MKVLIDIGGYDTEEVTVECINLEFLMQHFHVVAYGDFVAPFAPMITIGELMETIEPDKAEFIPDPVKEKEYFNAVQEWRQLGKEIGIRI